MIFQQIIIVFLLNPNDIIASLRAFQNAHSHTIADLINGGQFDLEDHLKNLSSFQAELSFLYYLQEFSISFCVVVV